MISLSILSAFKYAFNLILGMLGFLPMEQAPVQTESSTKEIRFYNPVDDSLYTEKLFVFASDSIYPDDSGNPLILYNLSVNNTFSCKIIHRDANPVYLGDPLTEKNIRPVDTEAYFIFSPESTEY